MNLLKTLGLLPVVALCVLCGPVVGSEDPLGAPDALPKTYDVRVFEAQNADGRFAVQLFVSDALVGELQRGGENDYHFANSGLVLHENTPQDDIRVLRESLLALAAQTRAMLAGHAYREGPPRTAKNIRRATTCAANVLAGSITLDSKVSFSENAPHREYTSQPVEEQYVERTLEACGRLTQIIVPNLALLAPDKAIAPVIKRDVTPMNDGKVMLSCSAQRFYPSKINMSFVAPQGMKFLELKGDSMPVFGSAAEGHGGYSLGKYDRTDFLFVDARLVRNVTCVVRHAGATEPSVLSYRPNAAAPLSPRESGASMMPAYNLLQFVRTRDARYVAGPAHVECLDKGPTAEYPFVCLE